jgi:hypothetical protein
MREKVAESEKNIPVQACIKESINYIHEYFYILKSSKNYGGIIYLSLLALKIVLELTL